MGDSRKAWLALFGTAIALRLAFALAAPHLGIFDGSESNSVVARGSDGYEGIARNLLKGNGYRIRADIAPTMMRNPGYVAVVAATFALFGDHPIVGFVLQSLISGIVVLLIGWVGQPVVGPGAAFLAAALYAAYPADWLACARYILEPMLGLLTLGILLALRLWMHRASAAAGALLGLAAGAMALTKSVAVWLLVFLLIWMVLFLPEVRRRVRTLLVPAAVALVISWLILLPWGWYNYSRSGHWIFTSTIVGWALFDSQYINRLSHRDVARVDLWLESRAAARRLGQQAGIEADPRDPWTVSFFDIRDEYAMGELLKTHALRDIKTDPVTFASGVLRGLTEFWYAARSRTASLIGMAMNLPILALGIYGALKGRLYRHPEATCWIATIVYMNLVAAVSFAVARYAIPVMPLVFLLATAGLMRGIGRWDSSGPIKSDRLRPGKVACDAQRE